MARDYFQDALTTFNGGMWYGWKTHDDDGNKIPNKDRMQYKHIKIIKEGATMLLSHRLINLNFLISFFLMLYHY